MIALLAMAGTAHAQGPSADWRTISTAHFRVHFPAPYEAWSTRAASRLESIRETVVHEVGFDPPQTIDVMIVDPLALANGLAWPLLDGPRIVLFTPPPGPDEQVGSFSNWIDLLAVHEVAHIIHMLRPSRNPAQRLLERFVLPLNPITLSAPRWVLEGYATVIEGRLTGAGRPSGTMRAIILRKWAMAGRFPTYAQLDSDSRFLGMSMAYLAGSAFLEWLEQRSGPDSLRRLWARMTARQRRSFDAAFTGVFGEPPERLYGLFVAEVTASALAVNRAAPLREGELWQETTRGAGDPAVSPDGKQIAIVLRPRNEPANLVIWSTGPAEKEEKEFAERIERIIKRDPQDVPPVRTKPIPRKPVDQFSMPDGGDIESPRWTRDSRSLLFSHRMPDGEGFLHWDIFRWTPETGELQRVTHLADVMGADPFPDGNRAVGVRSRLGTTQLVTINLATGDVQPLTEPSIDRVYSRPRVHADGRMAYIVHEEGEWVLRVMGEERKRAAAVQSAEWSGDDLVMTIARGGFSEVYLNERAVTRSSGGAFDASASPDGRVFFMALEPDGFVVRVVDAKEGAASPPPFDRALVPALPPEPLPATPFAAQTLPPSRPYGIGRQEIVWLVGEQHATDIGAIEVGVRAGDIVGRLDALAIGSIGRDDGERGGALAAAWRGWPVALSAHLFTARKGDGAEVRGSWERIAPRSSFSIDAGGLAGEPFDVAFVETAIRGRQIAGPWRLSEEFRLAGEAGSMSHLRAVAAFGARNNQTRVSVRYQYDLARDAALRVGGLPSSIVPDSAYATTVFDPALAFGTMTGEHYKGLRIEAVTPIFPATLFYQRHRTDDQRIAIVGLEATLLSGPEPILRLPAFDLRAGVARILDDSKTRWWLGVRWKP